MEEFKKKYLSFITKILVTIGILYYVFSYVDSNYAWEIIKDANYIFFLLAFGLLPLLLFIQYSKWRMICNKFLKVNSDEQIISSLFQGYAAGIFTPFRIGEFIARKFPFKNSSIKEVTVATFIDKFSTMFSILFVGVISSLILLFKSHQLKDEARYVLIVVFFIILLILIVLFSLLLKVNKDYSGIGRLKFFHKVPLLKTLSDKLELRSKKSAEIFKKSIFYSFPLAVIIPLQYALLYYSLNNLSVPDGFLIANSILIVKYFIPPITIGEIGVREIISAFVFTQLGMKPEIAVNAAILVFVINLIIPSLIGIYFTLRQKL